VLPEIPVEFTTLFALFAAVPPTDSSDAPVSWRRLRVDPALFDAEGRLATRNELTTGLTGEHSSPTVTTFGIDFNYRANALATKPLTNAIAPLFTGATQGFIGLYQINFIFPPPPANLPLCLGTVSVPPGATTVQSNFTVSFGSNFSFDGPGICVSPR
jgi:uncharacterized protein (TIGR03437 family)